MTDIPNATVRELPPYNGKRTFIIEASRVGSVKVNNNGLDETALEPGNSNAYWENKVSGLNLKQGDEVSIESAIINSKATSGSVMEFTGEEVNDHEYVDNKCLFEVMFYITNNGRNSIQLPVLPPNGALLRDPGGTTRQNQTYTQTLLPQIPPNPVGVAGVPPGIGQEYNGGDQAEKDNRHLYPVAVDYPAGADWNQQGTYTQLLDPKQYGITGMSQDFGDWDTFRLKNYPGYQSNADGLGANGQSLPAINIYNNSAGANVSANYNNTDFKAGVDPTTPSRNKVWVSGNLQRGTDNTPHILLRRDYQRTSSLQPSSSSGGTKTFYKDAPAEYTNPATGYVEPPRLEPATAFVYVDVKEAPYMDVETLANIMTEAFHQTNNTFDVKNIDIQENKTNSSAEDEKPCDAIPYQQKWGVSEYNIPPFGSPPTYIEMKRSYIWDSITPNITGTCVKCIPANFWAGCDLRLLANNQLTFDWREARFSNVPATPAGPSSNHFDWLGGSGVSTNNGADLTIAPVEQDDWSAGKFWNQNFYGGSLACGNLYKHQHGHIMNTTMDLYNLADTQHPTNVCALPVVMNTMIKSITYEHTNRSTSATAPEPAPSPSINRGLYEVSSIGSTEKDPASKDFTGNVLFTNFEYNEKNLKLLAEGILGKNDEYEGEAQTYKSQVADGKNWSWNMDIGRTDDFATRMYLPDGGVVPDVVGGFYPINDVKIRFRRITPYINGTQNYGWFENWRTASASAPTPTGDVVDPTTAIGGTLWWASNKDHNASLATPPLVEIAEYNLSPATNFNGCGDSGYEQEKAIGLGRMKVSARYWDDWRDDMVVCPQENFCKLNLTDAELSKKYGVGAYPYTYYDGGDPTKPLGVFIAFRVQKYYNPCDTPITENDVKLARGELLEIGRIEARNFCGISPCFLDDSWIKPMNPINLSKDSYNGKNPPLTTPADPPNTFYNFQNYCWVGANDTTVNWDEENARFTMTNMYTPKLLNIPDTEANQKSAAGVPIAGVEIAIVNQERNQIPYNSGFIQDFSNLKSAHGINDAISGISIYKVHFPKKKFKAPTQQEMNNYVDKRTIFGTTEARMKILEDTVEASPLEWEGSILDKAGWSYFDFFPRHGNQANRYSRDTYDALRPPKCNQSVRPLIMNSNTSIANALYLPVYYDTPADPPPPAVDSLNGLPTYSLGMNSNQQVNMSAESDELIARNLPTLFENSYYLLETNLIQLGSWIGRGSEQDNAVFYITKQYTNNDFVYSFGSSYSVMVDVDRPVGTLTNIIRNPNNGRLADLDDKSCIIYKIQRNFEVPRPMKSADGMNLLPPVQQSPEVELLQNILQTEQQELAHTLGLKSRSGKGGVVNPPVGIDMTTWLNLEPSQRERIQRTLGRSGDGDQPIDGVRVAMPQGLDEEGEVDWLEQTFGGGTNSLLSNTASGNILTDYARGVETEEGLREQGFTKTEIVSTLAKEFVRHKLATILVEGSANPGETDLQVDPEKYAEIVAKTLKQGYVKGNNIANLLLADPSVDRVGLIAERLEEMFPENPVFISSRRGGYISRNYDAQGGLHISDRLLDGLMNEVLQDVVANNGRFPNRLSARLINDVRANIDSGDLVARLPQERAGEGIPPLSEWRGYFALAQQEGTLSGVGAGEGEYPLEYTSRQPVGQGQLERFLSEQGDIRTAGIPGGRTPEREAREVGQEGEATSLKREAEGEGE